MQPGGRRWRRHSGLTIAVLVSTAALSSACTHDTPATDEAATAPSDPADVREADVASFRGGTSGAGCTVLETGDGTVMVTANLHGGFGESITPSGPVLLAPGDYSLSVLLGSGLTGDVSCTTDVPEDPPPPPRRVETNWPASAASATLEVVRSDSCASASLRLEDVVLTAPSGRSIDLGDMSIVNDAWFSWAPFECRLPTS